MDQLEDILGEMTHQLEWRGPTGRRMGHVVLPRADADALVTGVRMLLAEGRRTPSERGQDGVLVGCSDREPA